MPAGENFPAVQTDDFLGDENANAAWLGTEPGSGSG